MFTSFYPCYRVEPWTKMHKNRSFNQLTELARPWNSTNLHSIGPIRASFPHTNKEWTIIAKSSNCIHSLFIKIFVFCLKCHLSLVPIYACTRKRTLADFSKTIIVAMILCFLTYTVTASFGYLTFGSCVLNDILSSYRPTPDVLVAVIVIAIKMYTTYPILLFVGR